MRQSSFFFCAAANFAIAAAVYCLFWFFVTARSIFFALRSLLCVLPCSHIAGICEQQQQARPRAYKVLVLVAPFVVVAAVDVDRQVRVNEACCSPT